MTLIEMLNGRGERSRKMETLTFGQQFALKLLDWPFLLIAGAAALVYIYRVPLGNVIARGGVSIKWGDKSFSISELPEELNESFAPVTDDIEDLKQRVSELEARAPRKPSAKSRPADIESSKGDAQRRMLEALEQGQYRWRSIERLANVGAVSDEEAESILRPLDEVVFSRGKSGRTIARLKTR
jgi:hypothetical protein